MSKHPEKVEILEAIKNQPKISKVTVLSSLLAVSNKFHYIPKNAIDEIAKFTRIVRDQDNIIIDELHKTVPFLTKYEYTKVLGVRAKQIDSGATPFVKVPENMIDSYLIAKIELQEKKIPFTIRRPIANGGSEYWNLKDLEILVN